MYFVEEKVMNKICLQCKKEFISWSFVRKLCSRKCSAEYYKINYSGKSSKHYGIKRPELVREHMRQSRLGSKNPMFGKTPWNKGVPWSEETKQKVSKTKKDLLKRGVIKIWNKDKKTDQKVWNAGLNKKTSDKVREIAEKAVKTKLEHFKDPSFRENFRQKSSLSHKKYFENNPEAIEKFKRIRSGIIYPKKDTLIEQRLQKALLSLGVKFLLHYPFYNEFCETRIDIAMPENKLAIYCDGNYWHNLPNYKVRDQRINVGLKKAGWNVLRFWGSEINSDANSCAKKILEVIKNE